MAKRLLIGADIGTQGVKCVLFDEDGIVLSSSFIPSQLHQPKPGITEEDAEFQLSSVCRAVSECISASSGIDVNNIACMAIDGQMAGIIGVGEDGLAVTPYDSWLDTRCAPYIALMKREAEEEIIRKTGNPPSFNHGPKKLWWKHERPEVYAQIVTFTQPGSYAAMRLCGMRGDEGFIDRTYLHFSGFADNINAVWDEHLARTFDLDMDKLPRIVSPDQIVGEMTQQMARACGLKKPIPVAAGCGDTAASFLSCGAVRPGICIDVAGTASVFAATVDTFCYDSLSQVLGCGASATPGLWHPYAYINGGGMNLEWFMREIAQVDPSDANRFARLEPDELEPDESDPLFIPHMAGRVSPSQPHLRGTFAGLTWNHTRQDMYLSMLESVDLEYGVYRNALEKMLPGISLSEMRITGGGEKSRLWKLMKSAVLKIPVASIEQNQGAPMGSAILAGVAAGLFPSTLEAADRWITPSQAVEADARYHGFYEKRVARYDRLLDVVSGFYTG